MSARRTSGSAARRIRNNRPGRKHTINMRDRERNPAIFPPNRGTNRDPRFVSSSRDKWEER